jgi:signal recognition particle GTPase
MPQQAFEAMAARMTVDEKLNPRNVTAARKTEICKAAGTTPTIYNQMSGMHQEARAAFKSWLDQIR